MKTEDIKVGDVLIHKHLGFEIKVLKLYKDKLDSKFVYGDGSILPIPYKIILRGFKKRKQNEYIQYKNR